MRSLRRWTCKTYYLGEVHVDMPLEVGEEVVADHLDKRLCRNWSRASLVRGGLVKDIGQAGLLGKVR